MSTDYTLTTGSLPWPTGDTSTKTITIPISTAFAFNGTKTLKVTPVTPTGSASHWELTHRKMTQ